jgi:hypothetical protein
MEGDLVGILASLAGDGVAQVAVGPRSDLLGKCESGTRTRTMNEHRPPTQRAGIAAAEPSRKGGRDHEKAAGRDCPTETERVQLSGGQARYLRGNDPTSSLLGLMPRLGGRATVAA